MSHAVAMPVRRARWAVSALFWLNGATFASMLPRYPLIKQNLELTNTFFGLAVGLGPLGGLVTGLFASRVMRRFASAKVAVWAQVLQIVFSVLVLTAGGPAWFALGLFLMSATDVYTDVAMNVHGLRVQKLYGRSINNTFHGFWSVGAFSGGLLGAAFAGLDVALPVHAAISAAIMLAVNVALRPMLLSGPDVSPDESGGPSEDQPQKVRIPARTMVVLVALGLAAAFGAEIEDASFNWAALYLSGDLSATPFVAGLGLSAVMFAQTIGRFLGDRLVDRFGDRTTARIACGAATIGMGVALAFPSIWLTLVGFAIAGWGVATIVPAAYLAGDNVPGLPHGSGLVVVNWLLRLAFIAGPPIVGRLGDLVGLRAALLVMPFSTLMVVLLSGFFAGKDDRPAENQPSELAPTPL